MNKKGEKQDLDINSSIYYGGAKPFLHTTVFDGTSTKAPTNKTW